MILTVHLPPALQARIAAVMPALDLATLAAPDAPWESFLGELDSRMSADAHVVLVGEGATEADRLAVLQRISTSFPSAHLILCGAGGDIDLLAAVRAGARDVLPADSTDTEIVDVVDRAMAEAGNRSRSTTTGADTANRPSRVIVIASPKGGVGRTVIATNLAIALARRHPNDVALIDMDVQFGDVRHSLGLNPQQTLVEISRGASAMTPDQLRNRLTPHDSGLLVLPGTTSLLDAEKLEAAQAETLLHIARAAFGHVVIDTSAAFNDFTLTAFDAATDIVMIAATDIPGVRATRQMIEALDAIGATESTRHLVVNRSGERHGISVADVETACGLAPVALIPTAKEVTMALNQGIPVEGISARSPFARGIADLVSCLYPDEVADSNRRALRRRRTKAA